MRTVHHGVCADATSPVIEALEDRRMLSASLVRGILKVSGGAGDDTITVGLNGTTKISVNDGTATKSFTRTAVKTISILGGDGADTINIGAGIKQQITIKSGEGNDTVNGGSGREIIFGQGGDDQLNGGGGSDQIFGGDGTDAINGGAGNDYLYGDAGNDVINGDSGNDVLAGDLENTLVFSGNAPNVEGSDSLNGGDGNDWLLGERRWTGSGLVFLGDGQDTFTGGAGADVIDINKDGNDTITDKASEDFVPVDQVPHAEENQPGDVHEHVILKIRVRKGSGYKNVVVPNTIGVFQPGFFSLLHTHSTNGQIHFEAGPPNTTWQIGDFFRVWGISMDKNHVGRFIPPAGKKVTMWYTRGAKSSFTGGKWVTTGGVTKQTTKFGSFVPVGDVRTGAGGSGNEFTTGDIIEIRVG